MRSLLPVLVAVGALAAGACSSPSPAASAAVASSAAAATAPTPAIATGPAASSAPSAPVGPISTTVPATSAPAGSIRVELAGPPGRFEPADLTASAGEIVYFLENSSPGFHTLAIGLELHKILAVSTTVAPGDAAIFTVHGLGTGNYTIWCSIGDHSALGMVGTLTITP